MRGLAFRILLALCLLASTAQGFVAQTHVHAAALSAGVSAQGVDAPPAQEPRCVLCDVAGHTPAAAPPGPPPSQVLVPPSRSVPSPASSLVLVSRTSHHWWGRGPPVV